MNLESLDPMLNRYLATREAVGLKDRRHRKLLKEFLEYVAKQKPDGPIPAQMVVDWACSTPHADAVASQSFRLSIARAFLIHVKTVFPEAEIPPHLYLKPRRRPTPCLFSRDDILQLLDCAGSLKSRASLRPHTYRTIVGLLACTGLRASEAIRLRVKDVQLDLDPPVLQIFETKFRKSRLVPLHTTTAAVLRHYKRLRSEARVLQPADPFFISAKGMPVSYYTLKNLFARLVTRIGVSDTNRQRIPSLHSLRHSFAVERLTIWYQEGRDVRSLAPNLSVYMGHARLSASYWYLSASPDLLNAAADLFYAYAEEEGEHD